MSCADYLATLSKPQLRCWVRLNLSYDQVARVWLAIKYSPMDKDMKGWYLGRCIIRLCEHYDPNTLRRELAKESGDKHQVLPNADEINQVVLGLIEQVKHQHLGSLDISCLLLTSLPNNLFDLTQLEHLYLAGNLIETISDNISSLKSLTILDLYKNNLSFISPTIGLLPQLQYLDLDSNKLSSLPSEIGNLSSLTELSLESNQLSSLPSEIGNLTSLTKLYLIRNKLSSLLNEIGNLSSLTYLDLDSNQLSSLPSEINQLTNLRRLRLQANELLPIPPEILKLEFEPRKILNYYFELLSQKAKQRLNEAKMLVVGEGKVGKTSLVNRLVRNIFNNPEPMTEGVIIEKHWPVKLANDREIKVNIWDFGGQEIMHSTHQFFLTKRSLYLLVLDGRHDEQQNRLDYWLKTIENFADDAPIIIVCNQIDIKTLELDRKGLRAKYNIKAFVEISCKNGKGIDSLIQAIIEQLSGLKHIDDLLLASWFKIKEQLETIQNEHQDYLEYSEYKQMCVKEGIDTLSEETLIGFLHDLGVVLCFHKDPRVKTTQILNPDWVTAGVYKILNYRGLAINKGELQISCLNDVLNDIRYPENKHFFIIEMMRKFELCFDLDDSTKNKLLIPDLLPKEAPNLSDLSNWDDTLRFEYHYDLLPSSVISRFIVRMNTFIYDKTYWRYGVVLESEDNQNKALVKADLDAKKIFIFVNGREASRKDLLSLIRADLRKIHKTIPKLQYEQKILLTEDPSIVLDYEYLLQLLQLGEEFIIPKGLMKKIPIRPLLDGIERIPNNMNEAFNIWQERKNYLEQQLATLSDPNQKFALRKQIKECEREITRLQFQTAETVQTIQTSSNPNSSIQNTQTNNVASNQEQPTMAFKENASTELTDACLGSKGKDDKEDFSTYFLTDPQKQLIEELKIKLRETDRGKFIFLVVGQTGVGKSSTINTLMGEVVSPVNAYEKQTLTVHFYDGDIYGIGYTIVDTPGLGDTVGKQVDKQYLTDIKRKMNRIDCMLFVTRLDHNRVNAVEINTIERISSIFNIGIWDRAIIIFTYADKIIPSKFEERLKMRSKLIREEIAKQTGELIARNIPTVAVANDEDNHEPLSLPNGESWLGNLYSEVFTRISKEGALPFYLATINRIENSKKKQGKSNRNKNKEISLTEEQLQKVANRIKEDSLLSKVSSYIKDLGKKISDSDIGKKIREWFT